MLPCHKMQWNQPDLCDRHPRRRLLAGRPEAGAEGQAVLVAPEAFRILAVLYQIRVVRPHDLRHAKIQS